MDFWKYFEIGHANHVICNPLNEAKLDEAIGLLRMPERGRLLDIACGKGELLARAGRRWGCTAVGVDLWPYAVADARARVAEAGLADSIEIVEANAAEYEAPAHSFDVTACLGASWIWGGHAGTLAALAAWTKPGGLVVAGQPFWRREPSPGYLKAAGLEASSFDTHTANFDAAGEVNLQPLHAIASNEDDFDRYEGYQWHAAELYARENPDDPDVSELLSRMHTHREAYTKWGRDELGWAVYLFLKP